MRHAAITALGFHATWRAQPRLGRVEEEAGRGRLEAGKHVRSQTAGASEECGWRKVAEDASQSEYRNMTKSHDPDGWEGMLDAASVTRSRWRDSAERRCWGRRRACLGEGRLLKGDGKDRKLRCWLIVSKPASSRLAAFSRR
jgi:hypothetical protein